MESVMGLGAWPPETRPWPNRHQPMPGGLRAGGTSRPLQLFRATRRRAVAASRLELTSHNPAATDAPPAPLLPMAARPCRGAAPAAWSFRTPAGCRCRPPCPAARRLRPPAIAGLAPALAVWRSDAPCLQPVAACCASCPSQQHASP